MAWAPAVDICERRDAYRITAEVPGVSADDVEVTFEDGLLTIQGERHRAEEASAEQIHRSERPHGRFRRSIMLPSQAHPGARWRPPRGGRPGHGGQQRQLTCRAGRPRALAALPMPLRPFPPGVWRKRPELFLQAGRKNRIDHSVWAQTLRRAALAGRPSPLGHTRLGCVRQFPRQS